MLGYSAFRLFVAIDLELKRELHDAASACGAISVSDLDAIHCTKMLRQRFVLDDSFLNWWESLKVPTTTFSHRNNDECLTILCELAGNGSQVVLLTTDEDSPPWLAYQGKLEQILFLISNCRFFEFLLFQPDSGVAILDMNRAGFAGGSKP
ncbi:hypothetical protein ACSBOB_17305 [Mesorhizobium sp. ASY16-5R]|uniref:hypothetical protein n=1 Tax=Mesorhizobium sp. ASY16-5R TaxID=3445772 RepID=UPI003F9FBBED